MIGRKEEDSFKVFVLDQLAQLGQLDQIDQPGQINGLGRLTCRAMFGGFGLYHGKTFFGILFKGRLYFKTSPETRTVYLEKGMKPFRPNDRQTLKSYYEVPVEIIEDPDALTDWARAAIQCAGGR